MQREYNEQFEPCLLSPADAVKGGGIALRALVSDSEISDNAIMTPLAGLATGCGNIDVACDVVS